MNVLPPRLHDVLEVAKVDAEDVVLPSAEGAGGETDAESLEVSSDGFRDRHRRVEQDL